MPDSPGMGRSPLISPYSLDAVVESLERDLTELGAHARSLAGFSLGSYLALALALRGTLSVSRLALVGAVAGWDPAARAAFKQLAQRTARGEDFSSMVCANMHAPGFAASHPEVIAKTRAAFRAVPAATFVAELEAISEMPDLRPRLGESAIPVALRVGELDVATPAALSREIAGLLPDAALELVPGCGHQLFAEDEPATTAWLVRTFE